VVAVPPTAQIVLQLEDVGKNCWLNYLEDVQDAMTAAAVSRRKVVNLVAGRTALVADISSLRQLSNGGEKRMRGLVKSGEDLISWEVKKGDEWEAIPVGHAVQLEEVRDISNTITVGSVKYDLVNMKMGQKNLPIKREKNIPRKLVKSAATYKIHLAKHQEEEEEEPEPVAKKSKSIKNSKKSIKKDPNEEGESKPVMKSLIKKGLAPVDPEFEDGSMYHVFCEGRTIWDVMLNQTNIQNNNNKFYLIQLLQKDQDGSFAVWMRWGRVGYRGQTSLNAYDLSRAKSEFAKKFHDKTKNQWEERDEFVKHGGKYDLVKMDYSTTTDSSIATDQVDSKTKPKTVKDEPIESKLPSSVQELISLICNIKVMEEAVIEMEYDTQKAPLGKITVEQIRAGYNALKMISECVDKGQTSSKDLLQACNDFYTRIPHEFGMKKPPVIRTQQEVKKKLELLETLSDIQVALKILSSVDDSANPIDVKYNQLKVKIDPVAKTSDKWKLIEQSITSTHASTHQHYTMEVVDLFSLDKDSETKGFVDCGNSNLLYHGSRLSNWAGILSQGLKIAPPEAPVTGYMFGKGVYFADMSSKSANYCYTSRTQPYGLLMLCEVALGKPNKLLDADYHADQLPRGKNSVMGMGKIEPAGYKKIDGGLKLPVGPAKNTKVNNKGGYTLNYNEFIVYDTKQIKMKYLAKIKFNYKY